MNRPKICIAGAGAAGLWTAIALVKRGWTANNLVLIDPDNKKGNDRTYSFWSRKDLVPPKLIDASYKKLILSGIAGRKPVILDEYAFHTMRSGEFYEWAQQKLSRAGVRIKKGAVMEVVEAFGGPIAQLRTGERISCDFLLDSRPLPLRQTKPSVNATLQHFGGFFIETSLNVFDPTEAVFMDFAWSADNPSPRYKSDEVAFFYVLPTDERHALVELAVLSTNVWPKYKYDEFLKDYIKQSYGLELASSLISGTSPTYEIKEWEYGVIPMTDEALWENASDRIWPIGTRGGWVQPSSGFAFTRSRRFAFELADYLSQPDITKPWRPNTAEAWFNSVMLRYILENPADAERVFSNLFAENGGDSTLRFLDGELLSLNTVKVMLNSPKVEFSKIGIAELLRYGLKKKAP